MKASTLPSYTSNLSIKREGKMSDRVIIPINEDGVDLMGYTMWGCVDLVSASTGETAKRYGFVHVDKYDDGTGDLSRRRKDLFYWYKKIIESHGTYLD